MIGWFQDVWYAIYNGWIAYREARAWRSHGQRKYIWRLRDALNTEE